MSARTGGPPLQELQLGLGFFYSGAEAGFGNGTRAPLEQARCARDGLILTSGSGAGFPDLWRPNGVKGFLGIRTIFNLSLNSVANWNLHFLWLTAHQVKEVLPWYWGSEQLDG